MPTTKRTPGSTLQPVARWPAAAERASANGADDDAKRVVPIPDPFGRIKRNLTGELVEGATDGAIKKAAPNWSNRVADATDDGRRALSHVEGGYDWNPPGEADQFKLDYVRGRVRLGPDRPMPNMHPIRNTVMD
jgi:hypothetical protein